MSSWLDEELETARVEAKSKPKPPVPTETRCPSCNAPMSPGALICVKCGYDTRIRGKRTVERGGDETPTKRSLLGGAASLLRGTLFSFLGAMLGAIIWAVLVYLTQYEFSIVALGLGGLAGLGMAVGHESDDGTFPGIIAAFMSLFGIFAAKILSVVIIVAAMVSAEVSQIEIDIPVESEEFDAVEAQRASLALMLTMKELAAKGENEDINEAEWKAALARPHEAVANLTPDEIEARMSDLGKEHGVDGEIEGPLDAELADNATIDESEGEELDEDVVDEEVVEEDEFTEDGPTIASIVGSLFGPIDGLWILLAFFTAYKVGSGEATD